MESDLRPTMSEGLLQIQFWFPHSWIVGPTAYAIGLLISAITGNLYGFITDFPWACLAIVIAIALLASRFVEMQGKDTIAIRNALNITDEEFKKLLKANLRRLASPRNVLFGLAFLPGLLWALTQRLWWREYAQPAVFDIYYVALLVIVLLTYSAFMFGGAVSCNQNVYIICERTPINPEYLLDEGLPILRRLWAGLVLRVTVFALVLSALTNVPIILYSGSIGLLVNLAVALVLTALIFVVPHYLFHRLLERAKEEMLAEVSEKRRRLGSDEQLGKGDTWNVSAVGMILGKIYLTQYEEVLRARRTWLVNLEMVVGLVGLVSSLQGILSILVSSIRLG